MLNINSRRRFWAYISFILAFLLLFCLAYWFSGGVGSALR